MPDNPLNQSVQRAVRILHAVAGSDDGRTVSQIAAAPTCDCAPPANSSAHS